MLDEKVSITSFLLLATVFVFQKRVLLYLPNRYLTFSTIKQKSVINPNHIIFIKRCTSNILQLTYTFGICQRLLLLSQ